VKLNEEKEEARKKIFSQQKATSRLDEDSIHKKNGTRPDSAEL